MNVINLTEKNRPLVEGLAEIEHEQWITWTKEIAKMEKISPARLKRWEKLWKKPYDKLTDSQKEEDRGFALKVLPVVKKYLKDYYQVEIQ